MPKVVSLPDLFAETFAAFPAKGANVAAKSDKTLKLAVIGLGIGRNHLKDYQGYDRSEVVAVCDKNAGRLKERGQAAGVPAERCYNDYKKLLRDAKELGLDAVSVAVPNALHAPVTVAAAKAGLHVLCEKPMAMNAREARRMMRTADEAGTKLMINFSFRFTDQSQALKRLAESGAVGDIYYGRTVWHRRRGLPGFGGWFGQKELAGGGPIIDLGVHRLDLALWLMGNPKPVTVSASTYGAIGPKLAKKQRKKFDVEDLGCALVRFDNDATLIVEASWAGFSEKKEDMVTQLWGTTGGIIQRNLAEGYTFEALAYSEKDGALWESRLQQPLEKSPSAYRAFVDAVLDDTPLPAPAEHGLGVQLILDAI
ncbi:MAG: Gfo/Idh/MocA family protein, partial [Phycisphaerae bacterium]